MAQEQFEGTQPHSHRRDPSAGGWDTQILKAPETHKSELRRRRRRKRHVTRTQRVLQIIGIVVAVVVGIAAAVALGLVIALAITSGAHA